MHDQDYSIYLKSYFRILSNYTNIAIQYKLYVAITCSLYCIRTYVYNANNYYYSRRIYSIKSNKMNPILCILTSQEYFPVVDLTHSPFGWHIVPSGHIHGVFFRFSTDRQPSDWFPM